MEKKKIMKATHEHILIASFQFDCGGGQRKSTHHYVSSCLNTYGPKCAYMRNVLPHTHKRKTVYFWADQ